MGGFPIASQPPFGRMFVGRTDRYFTFAGGNQGFLIRMPGVFVPKKAVFYIYRKENFEKSFLSGAKSGIIN